MKSLQKRLSACLSVCVVSDASGGGLNLAAAEGDPSAKDTAVGCCVNFYIYNIYADVRHNWQVISIMTLRVSVKSCIFRARNPVCCCRRRMRTKRNLLLVNLRFGTRRDRAAVLI